MRKNNFFSEIKLKEMDTIGMWIKKLDPEKTRLLAYVFRRESIL